MTKEKRKLSLAQGEMESPVKKQLKEATPLNRGSVKGIKLSDKAMANSSKFGKTKLKATTVKGKFQKGAAGKKDLNEKPDWMEFKKNKKDLKKTRKLKKCATFDAVKAKQLWEKLRRTDCPANNKLVLTIEIHGLLKGHLHKVVYAHDLGRVVQWLLKIGAPDIRTSVTEELVPALVLMLQSKYAAFCVKRILKYGSKESRHLVIERILGNTVKLMSHVIAAPVVEYAYNTWASPTQKNQMRQEFYGDVYKLTKDDSIHSMFDVWNASPTLKEATLATTKANLTKIFNKKLATSSLIHTILLDYLEHCSPEERAEMLVQIRSLLLDIMKTKDGARVAMMCFWHGTNKDRKMGMKALKEHVKDIANSEFGHLVLLAMFDCIDDTVLLKKMLLVEVVANATEIASDEFGRRVILYLVAHRDPHYFHPAEVEIFKKGEMLSESKKDVTVRKAELLAAVLKPLLETIAEQTGRWLSNGSISLVTLAVLKAATGSELKTAFQAIVRYICDPINKITEGEREYCAMEHTGVHMMIKKMIQHEKQVALKGKDTFSSILMLEVTKETLLWWTTFNRGCFILVALLECGNEPVINKLKEKMSDLLEHLKIQSSAGAQIIVKKLTSN